MNIKLCITSILFVSVIHTYGQPVINNAEDYIIGNILHFKPCNPNGVSEGNPGSDQIWNFSGLTLYPDTLSLEIVLPSTTTYADSFPGATMVEEYSDGRLIYFNKTTEENLMLGLVDNSIDIFMHFTNSALIAKRPLTYNSVATDSFLVKFKVFGQDLIGTGSVNLNADGYGTLILPHRSYNNVLRVKSVMVQRDSVDGFGNVGTTTTTSFTWYDGTNAAPLMRIITVNSTSGFADKQVSYLLNPTTTGIKETTNKPDMECFPNPASNQFIVKTLDNGKLSIISSGGQLISVFDIKKGETTISIQELSPGIYFTTFQTDLGISTNKLVVE